MPYFAYTARDLKGQLMQGVLEGADSAAVADQLGWGARAMTASPLPGPSGNVEFFLWLRRGPTELTDDAVHSEVQRSAGWGAAGEKVDP